MLIAQLIGGIASLIGITAFLHKDDVKFRYQLVIYCQIMAVHFFLIGATVASIGSLINSLRFYVSIRSRSKVVMLIFMALLAGFMLPNVEMWYEVLPVVGSIIGTWALFSFQGIPMRALLMINSSCWLIHNIMSNSIGGSLIESAFILANGFSIYRLMRVQSAVKVE